MGSITVFVRLTGSVLFFLSSTAICKYCLLQIIHTCFIAKIVADSSLKQISKNSFLSLFVLDTYKKCIMGASYPSLSLLGNLLKG